MELSLGIEQAEAHTEQFYKNSNGSTYLLSLTKWEDHEHAVANMENASLFITVAVINKTRIVALGPNRTAEKELITSVPCVREDEVMQQNFTEKLNLTNVTNISITPYSNASIARVETELGSDYGGTHLNITVHGEFRNTTLEASLVNHDAKTYFSKEELANGTATRTLYLPETVAQNPGTYTLRISAMMTDETVYKDVDIEGPQGKISNIEVRAKAREFTRPELEKLSFTIVNPGSLSYRVQDVNVIVNGEENTIPIFEKIGSGESITISSEDYPIFATGLKEGKNVIRLEVVARDSIVASANTSVTVNS